jgi:hypothetical protein
MTTTTIKRTHTAVTFRMAGKRTLYRMSLLPLSMAGHVSSEHSHSHSTYAAFVLPNARIVSVASAWHEVKRTPKADDLDTFTRAYVECLLWSENHSDEGSAHDGTSFDSLGYGIDDISPAGLASIIEDCNAFQHANESALAAAGCDEQNGHDFCLTRNRHGAGFWDRGYREKLSRKLTDAAHAFGETHAMFNTDDDAVIAAGDATIDIS